MILGDHSHINLFEKNGMSIIAGVIPQSIPESTDGTINLQDMQQLIEINQMEEQSTALISIENTHNYCGGRVLPVDYLEQVTLLAQDQAIPLHLDGARIWHAAVATGRSLPELVNGMDSVSVSLSKGLGAPAGSLLLGSTEFIHRARKARKVLGGAMRQVGIIAAAGLQAGKELTYLLLSSSLKYFLIGLSSPLIQSFSHYVPTNVTLTPSPRLVYTPPTPLLDDSDRL